MYDISHERRMTRSRKKVLLGDNTLLPVNTFCFATYAHMGTAQAYAVKPLGFTPAAHAPSSMIPKGDQGLDRA